MRFLKFNFHPYPCNELTKVHDGKPPDCMHYWYINDVRIPGEAVLPDDVAQSDLTCIHQAGSFNSFRYFQLLSRQHTIMTTKRSFPGTPQEQLQLPVLVGL